MFAQQRAIFALHDSDSLSGVQPFELLARRAMFIRQSVYPPLTLTVDCTVKFALVTMGQAKAAAIRKNPASAAYSETDHRRRMLTVLGRTGAVLLMEPAREENVHDQSSKFLPCLERSFANGYFMFLWTNHLVSS